MYSATTPRLVLPRGNLSEAEQANIALFDQVSPSVVQVVGRQAGESAVGDETEGTGVQSGNWIHLGWGGQYRDQQSRARRH
jgi:hypothetical protein